MKINLYMTSIALGLLFFVTPKSYSETVTVIGKRIPKIETVNGPSMTMVGDGPSSKPGASGHGSGGGSGGGSIQDKLKKKTEKEVMAMVVEQVLGTLNAAIKKEAHAILKVTVTNESGYKIDVELELKFGNPSIISSSKPYR